MRDHDLRFILNDELHGRPGLAVVAPSRITSLAFTLEEGDGDPLLNVTALCHALGVKPPAGGASHHLAAIDGGTVKYERHGEFYRVGIIADGNGGAEAIAILPLGWIDGLPGKRLVGIHTHVLPKSARAPDGKALLRFFGHDDLAGSEVSRGLATVWTDFRIGEDGYTRALIQDRGLSPARLGRVARRLHEIETYRMMALLALPLARELQKELGPLERSLGAAVSTMLEGRGESDDRGLLARLSAIARDVEDMSNSSSYRFSAARAYAALVSKRVDELGEERVMNYQRLGVFLDRRFGPAMATCNAVSDRIAGLAQRCERASNLLRTRVDIALEGQNQQLLKSMEQRARQQLMLQETVEGLSVVAISYYLIGILTKLFEGIGEYAHVETKLVSLIAIPVVVGLVWFGMRRLRHRILRSVGARPGD